MTLDIGCGSRKIESDAIGIDVSPDSAADHVWNLDHYPWPLEDSGFSRIHMSHVIEHLDDPMLAMAEVYRVAADGADVFVTTPHLSSHNSYTDPTHKRHLAAASFEYRSEEHTSELQSLRHLVCRLLLEKKKNTRSSAVRAVGCLRRRQRKRRRLDS